MSNKRNLSEYGYSILNTIDEIDRDAVDARLLRSFGVKIFKDGNKWCALLGDNTQEGHAEFADSPVAVTNKMSLFLYTGKEQPNDA